MDMIDLEIYRWKWFRGTHLQRKSVQTYKQTMYLPSYWKEVGAFVSVLPRQTGKTTILLKMMDIIKDTKNERKNCILVTPNFNTLKALPKTNTSITNVSSFLHGCPERLTACDYHLFIDEFERCINIEGWLNYSWASVTMTGTLK